MGSRHGYRAGLMASTTTLAMAGYRDTGYDPDEIGREGGMAPDIRSTTRRVGQMDGRRILAIIVHAYEDFTVYWSVEARLDSRDGPRADYLLDLFNLDNGGSGCYVYEPGEWEQRVDGKFAQSGSRAVCRVPAGLVRPTKKIRWKLISPSLNQDSPTEHAPDSRGWYS
jgi:hypothetical protein